MMLSVLATALVAAAPVDDAWCARAERVLAAVPAAGAEVAARFDETTALFEPTSPVVARARALVGPDDDYLAAFAVLATAAGESCGPVVEDDAARTAALLKDAVGADPRFAGVRRGDDLFDRLRHKVFMWLASLLETEGMQRFAGSTRTVFFTALAVVALVLAVRVMRRMRKRGRARASTLLTVDAARREAFAALRAVAGERLRVGDARGALLTGARALLVRVGERDERATRAAFTHREILATLAPAVTTVVTPALVAFERALFAGEATLDDATGFLALVDEAATVVGMTPPPGAAS